jgi:hypothetical protein
MLGASDGMRGGMGGMSGGMGGMGGGMGGMSAGFGGGGDGPAPGNHRPANKTVNASTSSSATSGKEAIDLAQGLAELKNGARSESTSTQRSVAGRRFRKVREAWVDQAFKTSAKSVRLRFLGKAYFRILAQHPELSPIFALGKQVTFMTPSGTAVIIDNQGPDDLTDADIDRLFVRIK